MMRRSYTPAEIDTSLLVLALTGRNSVEAARRLKAEGIDVNPRTLRSWRETVHAGRYAEICRQHAPRIEAEMVNTAREIVLKANEATVEAIEATRAQMKSGDLKDASTAARNLATVSGIQTDKALLVEGRPTVIAGSQDVESLIRSLGARMNFDVEGTAEEIDVGNVSGGNVPPELPPAA